MVYGTYVSVQATDVADICELQPCHKFNVSICRVGMHVDGLCVTQTNKVNAYLSIRSSLIIQEHTLNYNQTKKSRKAIWVMGK